MTDNLYDILGVASSASKEEIKKAYRTLITRFHPDRNPEPSATERFREIQKAYEVLGSEERRPLYDRYGDIALNPNFKGFEPSPEETAAPYNDFFSNFTGSSHGTQSYRGSEGYEEASQSNNWGFGSYGQSPGGFGTSNEDYSHQRRRRNQKSSDDFGFGNGGFEPPQKGTDIRLTINISMLESIKGCQRVISVERATRWKRGSNAGMYKENLTVDIPKEANSGQQIRIRSKGNPGQNGGAAGDLLVTVDVVMNPNLYREGADLFLQVPLTMQEAILGTKIEVPTLNGVVRIQTPSNVRNGQKMRLKNRGAPKKDGGQGDFYLVLRPIPPEGDSERLKELAKELEAFYPPGGVRHNLNIN